MGDFDLLESMTSSEDTKDIVKQIVHERKTGVKRTRGGMDEYERSLVKKARESRWRKFEPLKSLIIKSRGQRDIAMNPLSEVRVVSLVDENIKKQQNAVRQASKRLISVFVEKQNPSVNELDSVVDDVMEVCVQNRSISVCGELLDVADVAMFANDEMYGRGKGLVYSKMPESERMRYIQKRAKLLKMMDGLRDNVVVELVKFERN